MKQFEYMVEFADYDYLNEFHDWLNNWGKLGWQAVSMFKIEHLTQVVFMRELPSGEAELPPEIRFMMNGLTGSER